MTGTIALLGGGPFVANDELDARLIETAQATEVVVLPTADAFEHPSRLIETAQAWGERLGVSVDGRLVLRRADANQTDHAAAVYNAKMVYLAGDSPLHLRSVLKDTALFDALSHVLASGGVVAATGASAAALCDPMTDPRGGAFSLGLGLVNGLAVLPEVELMSPERLHRTLALATGFAVAVLPTGAALLGTSDGWERVGKAEVHGDLATVGIR
ncbi:MAG TPA: Type 1 glutamine amidotransferase-like domain-containing protein [Ilumatobacteraceae bacterium]|nr:Type 1 glutamine amidotransferase-like domain-containing protein [Ilumatobacteraceae bacterium]